MMYDPHGEPRSKLTEFERYLYDDADVYSEPVVYKTTCYICRDPDYAMMGLPLCRKCWKCEGHVAADDTKCDDCGADEYEDPAYEEWCKQQAENDDPT